MIKYYQIVILLPLLCLFGCNQTYHHPPLYTTSGKQASLLDAKGKKRVVKELVNGDAEKSEDTTLSQSLLDEALDLCNASQDFWQKGDFDNAIQALDQAYTLILKTDENSTVDENNITELMQQKEDIRFLISKRILEIYASRNNVVNGDHNAIPMTLNSDVQREIDSFTQGPEKDFFMAAYQRSGKYRPFIVDELSKAGLPVELSWLPLIESGFKPHAFSKARALGLWQFIPSTGYKFGLERNDFIDERLDPEKSTEAAIKYLAALHQMFGDWSTVLAAYNSGEGCVLRIIRTQGINYLDNFWDLYKQLPCETARYVPRFLAVLHIVSDPGKYGLSNIELDSPIPYETVAVSKSVHLQKIASAIGVDEDTLVELNPELRREVLPDVSYNLKVPTGKKKELLATIGDIPVFSCPPPESAPAYHRVQKGETLATIANRYHITPYSIAQINKLGKNSSLKTGQLLKIPLAKDQTSSAQAETLPKTTDKATQHVVARGDSLWNIAQRYGVTVSTIQRLNNLSPSSSLTVGQVLRLSEDSNKNNKKKSKTYRVRPGDTPFIIARDHGMPLEQFLELNHLTECSKLFPEQSVYVK